MSDLLPKIITAMFVVVAVIHLLPLAGVLGAAKLTSLYAIPVEEPNLEILMRHRAVLFGILGVFLLWAGWKPEFQMAGLIAGFASVISFLVLAWQVGHTNEALQRVVVADLIALVCLLVAAVLVGVRASSSGA